MLYLDNAATSIRKPACVYKALFKNTLLNSANAGRGSHKPSLTALNAVISAQDAAARLFNIKNPMNIAFLPNATYALNAAILGAVCKNQHIVVTAMDHNSVLRPVFKHGEYTIVTADKYGYVSPADVEKAIRPNTRLIVCTHASNVCGTIEPIVCIGKIAKRHGVLFLIDAAQTAGCVPLDAEKTNADFIAFSGHKGLMGPLGTGGLYVRDERTLSPVITGGTGSQSESMLHPTFMPDMLYAGTLNSPAIAALGRAMDFVMRENVGAIGKRETEMANDFCAELKNMDGITTYGKTYRTGTAAFNINGLGSDAAAELLSENIIVRAGYHCAPMAHRALKTDKTGAVRVSFGFFNRNADVKKAIDAVWKALKKHKG